VICIEKCFNSDEIVPIFDDRAYNIICDIISSACLSCYILAYDIRIVSPNKINPINNILGILKYKREKGIDIKILLNGYVSRHLQSKFNAYSYNLLKKDGFEVRKGSRNRLIHAKMVLVDKKILFLGSHNFTKSSFLRNRESGILINNKEKTAEYTKYFNELWKESEIKIC